MTKSLAPKLKGAAVLDPEFDRLPLLEKRAWLKRYLAEGKTQFEAG